MSINKKAAFLDLNQNTKSNYFEINYSCVDISSNEVFSKILKKQSISTK